MDNKDIISILGESSLAVSNTSILNDPISRRKFVKRTGGSAAAGFFVLQGLKLDALANGEVTLAAK